MIVGETVHPEAVVVNEVWLRFLIEQTRAKGGDATKLEQALSRVLDGKDWRTGE